MALHELTAVSAEPPPAGTPADDDFVRRDVHGPTPANATAMLRTRPPSRRMVVVRMAPATFLWLIAAWAAAVTVLAAVVLATRRFL